MMPFKCWRIGAILGLTVPLALLAAGAPFEQESGSQQGSHQQPAPAKAVTDPDAPPPPDDPQAQPLKRDDDLAPEPEGDASPNSSSDSSAQGTMPPESVVHPNPAPAKAENIAAPGKPAAALALPASSLAATEEAQVRTKYDREAAELLSLVQDLKLEVEKAGSNTLSLAALRKADEIQRLAKDLKEKMRDQGRMVPGKP